MTNSRTDLVCKKSRIRILEKSLDQDIHGLKLIKENYFCSICQVDAEKPLIAKFYRGTDTKLARLEAEGVNFYHGIAKNDPDLIDAQALCFEPEHNLVVISFVEGEPLSGALYRSLTRPWLVRRLSRVMEILGRFLQKVFSMTKIPGGTHDPFFDTYFVYCSKMLSEYPLLGPLLWSEYSQDSQVRWRNVVACEPHSEVSFAHGDFVFQNVHISGDQVGIIDFANTSSHSHLLNDVYNLRSNLKTSFLPVSIKQRLWEAFSDQLDLGSYNKNLHRFYDEFHRRRWLWVTLENGSLRSWSQLTKEILVPGWRVPGVKNEE